MKNNNWCFFTFTCSCFIIMC